MSTGYRDRSFSRAGTVTPLSAVIDLNVQKADAVESGLGYWLVMLLFSLIAPAPLLPTASYFSVSVVPGVASVPL